MKRTFAIFLLFVVLSPISTYAAQQKCTSTGYTIIYVNGILTDLAKASQNKDYLKGYLPTTLHSEPLTVQLGYNPSHLYGLGDITQAIAQAMNSSVSDFDLQTILMQIHPNVTTQKILLVGHSQGTFYTNELYRYLIDHGVPRESIAVYNLATPASFVSGGGGYVTSSNDALVNRVRDLEVSGDREIHVNSFYTLSSSVSSALRANITIPKEDGWEGNPYGGHGFDIYLDGATDRIVGDIQSQLSRLQSSSAAPEDCFEPPSEGAAYQIKKVTFAVSDSIANMIGPTTTGTARAVGALVSNTYQVFAGGVGALQHALATLPNSASQTSTAILPLVVSPAQQELEETNATLPVTDTTPGQNDDATPVIVSNTEPIPPVSPPPPPQAQPQPPAPQSRPSQPVPIFSMTPGFGGGGGGASTPEIAASTPAVAAVTPASVSLGITSPIDGATFATSLITISGTADDGADILILTKGATSESATTTAVGGVWSVDLSSPEGALTISASAQTSSGTSATSSVGVTIDTTAPAQPTLIVLECASSLSPTACVVPTHSVTLLWDDVPGATRYRVITDGVAGGEITATTTNAALSSDTTTFAVVAYDASGNAATSAVVEVAALTQPLILNEIGWGGLGSSSATGGIHNESQWIELKNLSAYDIDLSNFMITRSNGDSIALSGTIPKYRAGSTDHFFVVGRSIPAGYNQTNTYGKSSTIANFAPLATSSAEMLQLVWNGGSATTTIDTTPAADTCTTWCVGSYYEKIGSDVSGKNGLFAPRSMERITGTVDGLQKSSWQITDSYGTYVPGGAGSEWGTPGNENSRNLPEAGAFCDGNLVLTDVAAPGPTVRASNCVYLMRFITGNTYGAKRYGAFFRGDVGSSTSVTGHSLSVSLASGYTTDSTPTDAVAGEHFFFAIWEDRARPGMNDTKGFTNYFTQSATAPYTPPHGNYVVVPFVAGE